MPRRIFISCDYDDQMKAKGFNLLRWNKNVDVEFVGRHLLDPVQSTDRGYITQAIKDQLSNTSVTVVLIGKGTASSDWVADEIKWSREKGNGILGICLEPGVEVPDGLHECGAEVIDWTPDDFAAAIERAATQERRATSLRDVGADSGSGCARS
jgi:hypothetical protein